MICLDKVSVLMWGQVHSPLLHPPFARWWCCALQSFLAASLRAMGHILLLQRWCCPGSIPHQSPTQIPLVSDSYSSLVLCLLVLKHLFSTPIANPLLKYLLLFCSLNGHFFIYTCVFLKRMVWQTMLMAADFIKMSKTFSPPACLVLLFKEFLPLLAELKLVVCER